MDKIWDRKSFEVIGRCSGDEKTNDHAEPSKVERYKTKLIGVNVLYLFCIRCNLFDVQYGTKRVHL